ncbi:hypothetical protein LJB84_00400 [Bacteroidales bacterium OttesenSCG-928-J19]|nr:hypothetical protein [Bacteroidales bacterium OttesenSCG-928-J19]
MILKGLYYPFSRCINLLSLKQMLLVFDNITFLDPVEDDEWRLHLYKDLEKKEDKRFSKYKEVYIPMKDLKAEGALNIVSPKSIIGLNDDEITASSLSDLIDSNWSQKAANPQAYGMPYQSLGKNNHPSWHIFHDKLPEKFIEILQNERDFSKHLIYEGDEDYSWILSYEAGSSISTNYHLSVANKLNLSPVTDSTLHHDLLIQKYLRTIGSDSNRGDNKALVNEVTQNLANTLLNRLLDEEELAQVSFEEILKFRESTERLRKDFVNELSSIISIDLFNSSIPSIQQEILSSTRKGIHEYQNELLSAKDKLWPTFIGSLNQGLAASGLAAVTFNYLGGTDYLLASSILGASLTLIKGGLAINNERRKTKREASPVVNYLTTIKKRLK